ncbi:hypothetical protein EJ110_NYTH36919 [Nymphaea thermarum]|nr:hypothetical protein EJ110_NYTH36919 [Nymphaea thermarum]
MGSFGRHASAVHSNLECFLDCTTPVVPPQLLPKTSVRDFNRLWHPLDKNTIEYFTLGDLWDRYNEWSAYGAGTPIALNSGETVVQYYVPYLSAIQIYTSKSSPTLRNLREESDLGELDNRDSFSDCWSDDSEGEKISRCLSNSNPGRGGAWDAASEDSSFDQEGVGLWPMSDRDSRLGSLYFEYFERSAPYGRIPLMDKINELAEVFPGLMSLKSIELSPASWMAVAWYPIYHIPTGRTVKDLSACFLTYHTLSSSFQADDGTEDDQKDAGAEDLMGGRKCKDEVNGIALPPFGLATYKMQGNLWLNPERRDQERLVALLSAAGSWLKQLGAQHHDFNYFNSRSI